MDRMDSKTVATSSCGTHEIKLGGDGELRCYRIMGNFGEMQIGWTPSGKTDWLYKKDISPTELGYL